MNKKTVVGFLIVILLFFQKSFVLASRQVDDYLFQYEKYREVYQTFIVARNKYLQYQTLTAKKQAETATKELILKRYQALRAYFLALKWKLRITPSVVGSSYRQNLQSQLDKEVTWIEDQNQQVNALNDYSLNDLLVISDRFEDKADDFELLAYQSLSAVLLGKMRNLQAESVAITNLLSSQIEAKQSTQAAELKEWLKEIENKNYLSQKEIEEAEKNQALLTEKKGERLTDVLATIQQNLEKSKAYLNEAYLFQKEVLGAI